MQARSEGHHPGPPQLPPHQLGNLAELRADRDHGAEWRPAEQGTTWVPAGKGRTTWTSTGAEATPTSPGEDVSPARPEDLERTVSQSLELSFL